MRWDTRGANSARLKGRDLAVSRRGRTGGVAFGLALQTGWGLPRELANEVLRGWSCLRRDRYPLYDARKASEAIVLGG